jgi:hypothetical protein
MMQVLAGREKSRDILKLDTVVDVRNMKVYYMEDDGGCPIVSPVHRDLKESQAKIVARLWSDYGIRAKKLAIRCSFTTISILWSIYNF